jgi:signal transduction histidine kinase
LAQEKFILSIALISLAIGLQGVEQRRRELIGDVTHELRTPLTIIHSYLEAINNQKIEPSEKIYQLLMKETKLLEQSIDNLQLLSKLEAGYSDIKLQPTQVYPLLSNAIAKFSEQLFDNSFDRN